MGDQLDLWAFRIRAMKGLLWLLVLLLIIFGPAVLACTAMRAFTEGLRTGLYGQEWMNTARRFESESQMESSWLFNAFCIQTWLGMKYPPLPPPPPPPTYVKYMPTRDQFQILAGGCDEQGFSNLTVALVLPSDGFRIDWGGVVRDERTGDFVVDVKVERWTGEAAQGTFYFTHTYNFGRLNVSVYDPKNAPYDMDYIPYNLSVRAWGEELGVAPFVVKTWIGGYTIDYYKLRVREPVVYVEYTPKPNEVFVFCIRNYTVKDFNISLKVAVEAGGKYRMDWGDLKINGTELRVDIKMEWMNGTIKPAYNPQEHMYPAPFLRPNQMYNMTIVINGKEMGVWRVNTNPVTLYAYRIK